MVLDYSKWDKMHFSDSEVDDEEDDSHRHTARKPNVSSFESPQKVQFGGGGKKNTWSYTDSATTSASSTPRSVSLEERFQSSGTEKQPCVNVPMQASSPSADLTAGDKARSVWTLNGGENAEPSYCWAQTKDEVVLRCTVPAACRVHDLKMAVTTSSVKVGLKNSQMMVGTQSPEPGEDPKTMLLDCEWAYEVEEADWELMDSDHPDKPGRVIVVTARKKKIVEDAVFWWKSALKNHEEIDVAAIKGRKNNFAEAWKEANEKFREKIKSHKKIEI